MECQAMTNVEVTEKILKESGFQARAWRSPKGLVRVYVNKLEADEIKIYYDFDTEFDVDGEDENRLAVGGGFRMQVPPSTSRPNEQALRAEIEADIIKQVRAMGYLA